jgi:hypothetical protein
MAWPTNPTNGSTTTINGVIYVYNSAKNAWGPASVSGGSTINYAGNVTAGNLNVTGNVSINSQIVPTLVQMMTYQLAF